MKKPQPTVYLKLPFIFNVNKMVAEVQVLLNDIWIPHFNTNGYNGNWNSIALYAPNGDAGNITAMQHDNVSLMETNALKKTTYLKEVLTTFKAPFLSVRLLKLAHGAFIKPHCDYNLGYEDVCFRVHIPIITNTKVEFMLNNDRLVMLPGECWYTNVNYTHSVANNGFIDRIHLVIDLKRNDWSDELFFSLAPKESFFPKNEESYSPETRQKILEELKRMEHPAAKALIVKLKNNDY